MVPRQQDNGVFTVQADVGPGDVTGVYYITFCNLPFDVSWQQLKDWLRSECRVDHVEVFRTSTSGWVRIKGKMEFEKAWKHLNGGVFHGRCIIASDRNKTEPIKIKQLLDFSNSSTRDRQRQGEAPLTQPASPILCGSPIASITPAATDGCSVQHCYAVTPSSWGYAPDTPGSAGYAAAVVPRCPATMAECLAPQYQTTYDLDPARHYGPAMPSTSSAHASRFQPASEQPSAPYQVVLKNIPHRCGAVEIDLWIRRKLQSYERGVDEVDVPMDESGEKSRGYAFICFNSSVNPVQAIKRLNRHNLRGRTLTASLKTDGGNPSGGQSSKEAEATKATDGEHGGDQGSSGPVGSKPSNSHRPSSSKPAPSYPVVAEGSSKKGKGKKN